MLALVTAKKKFKIAAIVIGYAGFILASSYSLIANYVNFKVISVTPPYSREWTTIYSTFFLNFRMPELTVQVYEMPWDSEFTNLDTEFNVAPDKLKPQVDQKNKELLLARLRTDWRIFLDHYLHNIVWLWDKYHLSYITDDFYPPDVMPIHIYNGMLLFLFAVGFGGYIVKRGISVVFSNPVILFTVTLFLYETFVFALVSSESRHTLPFYTILILWAGYGLHLLVSIFNLRKRSFVPQANAAA
jgi:hypothetical protein